MRSSSAASCYGRLCTTFSPLCHQNSPRPNRDRGRPRDLSPPTPPDLRVTYPAGRGLQSATRGPMETRPTQAIHVAAGERDRQRWAAAHTPRPLSGFDRVPGQIPAHPTPAPCAVLTPTPRLPQGAAPPTADPGVQLLDTRRRFRNAKGGVPPGEVPRPLAHDAPS